MQRFFIRLLLLLIVIASLTSCDLIDRSQSFADPLYLYDEDDQAMNSTPVSGVLHKPTATSLPIIPDNIQALIQALSCGEYFCQIDWHGWLNRPFNYPDRDRIDLTYPYASKGNGNLAIHHGVEFPNPYGTPVLAAGPGEVVYAGNDEQKVFGPYDNFYGNLVILRHSGIFGGEDLFSLYGHLSTIQIHAGDFIQAGDIVGQVGTSGVADGSHLHFEVRYGLNDYDRTINPILWFSPLMDQDLNQTSTLAGMLIDFNGKPIPEASITLQKLDDEGEVEKQYFFKTYAQDGVNANPVVRENFAMPDLIPGNYRLTYLSGTLYERFFTLEPGMLGFIQLQTK
jgi:murein DD-endopeptidase MepM/ murein hydrolase activator NlpD